MSGATLSYDDPETGERVELDVAGWQFVISSSAGEIARMDFPMLALTARLAAGPIGPDSGFDVSLVTPYGGEALRSPHDWWVDFRVTKSGGM